MAFLPHRYPMLQVDRIVELVPAKKSVGLKNVSISDAHQQGYPAGPPTMPGAMILEAMAQAAAIIVMREPQFEGMVPVLVAMDNVKFCSPVLPGDQLVSTAEVMWFRRNIGRTKSTATVDNRVVARMEITFALIPGVALNTKEPRQGDS